MITITAARRLPASRRARTGHPLTALTLALGIASTAAAQATQSPGNALAPGTPTVRAERLADDERIVLDGRLDEAIWQRTQPAVDFFQQDPTEGALPTERTEVHVAFDGQALYLGARLYDTDPSGIVGHQRQRDADLDSDDRFMWIVDTFLDGRTGYFFEVNPAGLMGDGLLRLSSGGNVNKSWDGIWDARVVRTDAGWAAEIRLPFRTLNFNPELDAWGINFQRTIRRKNEEVLWSGHRRTEGLLRPVHAGRLVGLTALSQGIGLETRPYAGGSFTDEARARTAGDLDVGVDVGYSLTPSLRVALTVNTDFAEAEVDDRRVNLTRFPLQFPERRQFFLEGSSVYGFAPASSVSPYFSRRIGLAGGQPVPIAWGARLGGQAGPYDIGVLQIRTGDSDAQPAETFTVGRLRRHLLEQSSLGVIYTRRSTDASPDFAPMSARQTLGADLELASSRFLGRYNAQFEGFYVAHTDPANLGTPVRERTARGVRVSFPNDVWQGHVSLREFGREWDPAVGFAPRRGFRRLQPTIEWAPRPPWDTVRRLRFDVTAEHLTDLNGRPETQRLAVTPVSIEFETGDRTGLQVATMFERLVAPFEISPHVVLPVGTYRFDDVTVTLRTASRRRVWGEVLVSNGGFWSGSRRRIEATLVVRPLIGVDVASEIERQEVSLPVGQFSTTLLRVRANWRASPWTSLTTNLQFDNVSDQLGLFSRFRWIVRPGSDVFLVYTHNWRQDAGTWATLSRGGTTKINYTHRF